MKKTSIVNLPVKISFIAVILVTLFGLFSSTMGYRKFLVESREIEKLEIEERKTELKRDIQRVIALINSQKTQTERRLKQSIQSRVYEAYDVAKHLYERYRDILPDEDLQRLIRESLRKIRFHDGKGYYFANRIRDGYEVLCATCEHLEDTIIIDWKDEKGQFVIKDMIDIVTTKGEGFYTYLWTKPNEEGAFPKIAFVKLFEPFGWFIGTGEYLDDIEKDIQKEVLGTLQKTYLGKHEYVFVLDKKGYILSHRNRELVGKLLPFLPKVDGVRIADIFRQAIKKPEGDYVAYQWMRPEGEEITEKLSYVAGFREWQWIIGTGFYYEEIPQGLLRKREALREQIRRLVLFYATILLGGIAVVLLAGRYFKGKVKTDAETLVTFLGKTTKTDRFEDEYVDEKNFNFIEFAKVGQYSNWFLRERITKEKALHESEAMLKSVFQAAPVGIGLVRNRILEWTNEKMTEMTGYLPEDLRNRSAKMLYPDEEEFERVSRVKHPLVEAFGVGSVETLWKRKDGQIMPILLNSAALTPGDLISGLVFTALDITARKAAEEALQQSEERYRTLVEHTLDGYFICDMPSGKFLFLNQRGCAMFGYDMEEGLGLAIWDVISTKDHRAVSDRIKGRLKGKALDHKRHTYSALRKDGSTFRAEILTSMVNYQGKRAIQGVIRDITEHERLQAQLQQTQRIDAIGTLAGGIAHDFNNILGIIVGNCDLAEMEIPNRSTAKHNLEEIRRACLRAKDMVMQILTFSRKTDHDMKPVPISSVIKESLKLMRASIPTTIEIHHSISEDTDTILGDATQINQVLINLCTNASHAMRKNGGTLDVRLKNVRVHPGDAEKIHDLKAGKYVMLTVRDTGHGISPDIKDKIFDPYFTTKEVGEGSGMGLAVVHGIVSALGGAISMESHPNRGTTFQVYFTSYEGETASEEKTPLSVPGGHGRVLLVDDEEAIVELERTMLERLGYSVEAKTSSLDALDAFKSNPDLFDVVITDQTMPHMTGKTLAGEMISLRNDIPVILCTGYSEMINEEEAKAIGIREYASKPLAMNELASLVRKVLNEP